MCGGGGGEGHIWDAGRKRQLLLQTKLHSSVGISSQCLTQSVSLSHVFLLLLFVFSQHSGQFVATSQRADNTYGGDCESDGLTEE